MANIVMFIILAAVILGSALMCVLTKSIMRSVTFLVLVLFGVAGLYFLLDYTFLGAAQISVYAGGITMIYIFAIQLVNKRSLEGKVKRPVLKEALPIVGLAIVGLIVVVGVFFKNALLDQFMARADAELDMNTIGHALMGSEKYQYVLPFEFISLFLLACIIGGLVISKKEK